VFTTGRRQEQALAVPSNTMVSLGDRARVRRWRSALSPPPSSRPR